MTDLLRVLPHFDVGPFASLIPVLDRHGLTTSELLSLEAAEIGKRTQLPLLDVKRLCKAVVNALHADLGVNAPSPVKTSDGSSETPWQTISTLDPTLDAALAGGIPTGYVTEITGESGAGKTQFLLALLLAVQLPPPHGLGRPAIYVSTEAALSTRRLAQMQNAHPRLQALSPDERQRLLDRIFSVATPDLESQEHILTNQVPVMVERFGVGLLVIDSVATNYRAEFERDVGPVRAGASGSGGGGGAPRHGSNMAARSLELVRLGMELRDLAQKHNLAVVVANQVADRFTGFGSTSVPRRPMRAVPSATQAQESPLATRSREVLLAPPSAAEPSSSMAGLIPSSSLDEPDEDRPPATGMRPPPPPGDPDAHALAPPALLLDHQQRWFTGWGDDPHDYALKTPSLGLVWSTQIAARIALLKRPVWGASRYLTDEDGALPSPHGDGKQEDEDEDEEDTRSKTQTPGRQWAGDRGGPERSMVGMPTTKSWRRWMKVVFAPHAPSSAPGTDGAVEFEVTMAGLQAVKKKEKRAA